MPLGTSIFLIAVGAILRYAVTASVSGIDLHTVGLILIIVGIVGVVLSLFWMIAWSPRRAARASASSNATRTASRPPTSRRARPPRPARWPLGSAA